jgi:hypothetical protein
MEFYDFKKNIQYIKDKCLILRGLCPNGTYDTTKLNVDVFKLGENHMGTILISYEMDKCSLLVRMGRKVHTQVLDFEEITDHNILDMMCDVLDEAIDSVQEPDDQEETDDKEPGYEPGDCEQCSQNDENSGLEYEANFHHDGEHWYCDNCNTMC